MSEESNGWVGRTLSGGRYRVDAKLGEGGMGFVYKAWDRNLDTDLVIKAPRKSMMDDPEFASRFALEIRSLVKLSHPNIVKVSDVGEQDDVPFAVMQYLAGGTLDERQDYGRDGRPLPAAPSTLAAWLPGMAAALDFIHGKGYIHRDVKPANILFDTHNHPYLSDFGVAKVLSDVEATAKKGPSGMTGIGIVLGTPEYMAPELIMGNNFDARVDQYALAVTAYELLCGRKPFTGETATAILVRQTTEAPPAMAELAASGSEAIARVILKGMAKKPGERHKNCVEFANALMAALGKAAPGRPAVNRLSCPTCGVGFALSGDMAAYKGRKSKCQACGTPFRVADDGRSLLRLDPAASPTPSGSVEILAVDRQPPAATVASTARLDAMPASAEARPASTMKMEAITPPLPSGAARAAGTMKMEAMPATQPSRAAGTMKMEALPATNPLDQLVVVDEPDPGPGEGPAKRSPLPLAIGGVGVAAALLLGVYFATRPSNEGTIQILVESPTAGAEVSIDGKPFDLQGLKAPIQLAAGEHKLEASGRGLVDYQKSWTVTPGPNPAIAVKLIAVPKPAPPPVVAIKAPEPPASTTPAPSPIPEPEPEPAEASGELARNQPPGRSLTGPAIAGMGNPSVAEKPELDAPPAGIARKPAAKHDELVANLTLRQILDDPEGQVDKVVSPSDLLFISTQVHSRPGHPNGLAVRTREGAYAALVKPGTSFHIVLDPELASHLRDQVGSNVVIHGEYPAILKMRVEKQPGASSYLGVVEVLEFLYYVDARFLVNGVKLNKALFALILTPNAPQKGLTRSYLAWEPRLRPMHVITNVARKFEREGKPLEAYHTVAEQAMNPNWKTAPEFHKWIMGWMK